MRTYDLSHWPFRYGMWEVEFSARKWADNEKLRRTTAYYMKESIFLIRRMDNVQGH